MACAIGCWVKDAVYVTGRAENDYKKAFLGAMTRSDTKMNTTIPGMIGHRGVRDEDEKKKMKEFVWLLKG